jgi:hypothetical protein
MNKKTNVSILTVLVILFSQLLFMLFGFAIGSGINSTNLYVDGLEINYLENSNFSNVPEPMYSKDCNVMFGDVCVDSDSEWFQCDMRKRMCYER